MQGADDLNVRVYFTEEVIHVLGWEGCRISKHPGQVHAGCRGHDSFNHWLHTLEEQQQKTAIFRPGWSSHSLVESVRLDQKLDEVFLRWPAFEIQTWLN